MISTLKNINTISLKIVNFILMKDGYVSELNKWMQSYENLVRKIKLNMRIALYYAKLLQLL